MRVLICGDRNFTDKQRICKYVSGLPIGTVIIHGNARGADTLAKECAEEMGYEVISFPALWDKYGRAAGPIRNQQMLDEGKPDLVVYFHDNLEKSKGTADMVRRAKKRGLIVKKG